MNHDTPPRLSPRPDDESPAVPMTARSAADAAERERAAGPGSEAHWQRRLLEELARDSLVERRRTRRWRIFFRLGGVALLLLAVLVGYGWMLGGERSSDGRHTALIDLDGVIAAQGGIQADATIEALQSAFKDRQTAAIVLRINSPGGSPVQAGIIADEIRRLRKLNPATPVYSVVEDICASGGYYIAAVTDRIFVDKASLVGSIGVVMEGFGFTGLLQKAGVERRVMTAGENKAFLDPFAPLSKEQQAHARTMLGEIHQQFIRVVRDGRGARLKDTPEVFSGLVWTGERSIELGLADEFGSLSSISRDVVKAERIVDFTRRESPVERFARRFGVALGDGVIGQLEAGASRSAPALR